MPAMNQRSILILYHFYPPDDVISARHFSDLAEGLANRGWDVTVYTSNRYCRN
ncbi:MAG: glycosyltransferase family 4 protein, partial [Dehalococcoidales bacterium]|nr:glycosyltransferase family 4 protein [Dehalococcoidales bacterium]